MFSIVLHVVDCVFLLCCFVFFIFIVCLWSAVFCVVVRLKCLSCVLACVSVIVLVVCVVVACVRDCLGLCFLFLLLLVVLFVF